MPIRRNWEEYLLSDHKRINGYLQLPNRKGYVVIVHTYNAGMHCYC